MDKILGKKQQKYWAIILTVLIIMFGCTTAQAGGGGETETVAYEATATNLATQFESATASSVEGGAEPGLVASGAVDYGNPDGYGWVSESNQQEYWIQLAFESPIVFSRYVVVGDGAVREMAGEQAANLNNPDSFVLQVSTDGTEWSDADAVTGNTEDTYHKTLGAPVTAQYVRLCVTGPVQQGNSNEQVEARIGQIELYNDVYYQEGYLLKEAIEGIKAEYQAEIDYRVEETRQQGEYEDVRVTLPADEGNGNWLDVLAVFAAETMSSAEMTLEIEGAQKDLLRKLYFEMNPIVLEAGTSNEGTVLNVMISSPGQTAEERVAGLVLEEEQIQKMNEIFSAEYEETLSRVMTEDAWQVFSNDAGLILSTLPPGSIGAALVETALTRVGHPYSQENRGNGDYVDCSYFTWWVYQQAGISIPMTSSEQAKYCMENGYATDIANAQPGDLLFWTKSSCTCGNWHEVHHAGIYIGDNKVIEASSSSGQVVIRDLWGLSGGDWQLLFAAKPYV